MLGYKVGHYIKYEDISQSNKKNILRSLMFIKKKFFPYGDMDKLKARLVANGSQQIRHLYDFISSVSLQVIFLLFNVLSYHRCMLSTVDIRGAFFNAELTPTYYSYTLKKLDVVQTNS